MLLRILFLAAALFSFLSEARASDYVAPTWDNLLRTLVRFRAIDISDPQMVDEYAIVTECDLYKTFFHDDFKWNQVRQAVRSSVTANLATFPTAYSYDMSLHLDRYDFDAKIFRFDAKSALHNVNAFALYHVGDGECGLSDAKLLPHNYRAVISAPIYMDGLPLAEKDAQALLARMNAAKNSGRIVYARFNIRVVYIEPLRKQMDQAGSAEITHYTQSGMGSEDTARLDARLESLAFYEDPERTKLIYQYQP